MFLLDHDLRILIADGEAIRRLPWFDEELFRGRLVAELDGMVPDEVLELSLTTYRAALEGERGGFEFLSEGLTFSVQAVPVRGEDEARGVRARRRPRHHGADPRRAADRAPRAPAEGRRRARALRARDPRPRVADGRGGDDGDQHARRRRRRHPRAQRGRTSADDRGRHRLPRWRGRRPPDPRRRERERRLHPADRGADDRRRHGGRDALRAGSVPAAARRRQQRERPDPGPRPAVRGPGRAGARAARVLRGRRRLPERDRDAHHRRRGTSPRRAGDAPRARCTTR